MRDRKPNSKCDKFTRSFAVCKKGRREQINVITAPIDASLVYGNNDEEAKKVRADKDGKYFFQHIILKFTVLK